MNKRENKLSYKSTKNKIDKYQAKWDKKEKIIPITEYSENIIWDKIKEYL